MQTWWTILRKGFNVDSEAIMHASAWWRKKGESRSVQRGSDGPRLMLAVCQVCTGLWQSKCHRAYGGAPMKKVSRQNCRATEIDCRRCVGVALPCITARNWNWGSLKSGTHFNSWEKNAFSETRKHLLSWPLIVWTTNSHEPRWSYGTIYHSCFISHWIIEKYKVHWFQ